jgi:hypothetical protein
MVSGDFCYGYFRANVGDECAGRENDRTRGSASLQMRCDMRGVQVSMPTVRAGNNGGQMQSGLALSWHDAASRRVYYMREQRLLRFEGDDGEFRAGEETDARGAGAFHADAAVDVHVGVVDAVQAALETLVVGGEGDDGAVEG